MSQLNPVDYVAKLYQEETDPLLRFLLLPLEELDDHVRYAAYLRGKYAQKVCRLEDRYIHAKTYRETLQAKMVAKLASEKDPETNEVCTIAKAERLVAIHDKMIQAKRTERETQSAWRKARAYLDSLDKKLDMIPGKQGLYNRHYEVERDS